jgi:ribosomal protein S18 acetylase RimI-like enzyme
MNINIRVYQEQDKERCREIALMNWPDEPRVRRHVGFELSDPNIRTLVAEIESPATFFPIIVGWSSWCWSAISYDVAEFVWSNIHPAYQGQGIGRKLAEARIKAIKEGGGKAILLTTGKPEVYKRYGFKTLDILPLWIGPETYLMSLDLQ